MKKSLLKFAALLLLLPAAAFAHTGVGEATGFIHGLSHPLAGADHFLAMVAVGLWAVQIGGRALWAVPCTFVVVMMFGALLGFFAVPVPFIEGGILVSLLILGVLIAGSFKLSMLFSVLMVGLFAIFHGHAHGAEMPGTAVALLYISGFALATAALHLAGIGLGRLMQKTDLQLVNRLAGGAIALSGVYLTLA